jgi:hypothetical protein
MLDRVDPLGIEADRDRRVRAIDDDRLDLVDRKNSNEKIDQMPFRFRVQAEEPGIARRRRSAGATHLGAAVRPRSGIGRAAGDEFILTTTEKHVESIALVI